MFLFLPEDIYYNCTAMIHSANINQVPCALYVSVLGGELGVVFQLKERTVYGMQKIN